MLVDDDDAKKRLLDEGLKGRELRLVRWPWYHDQPRKIWLNYPTHQSVVGEWVPLFPSESIYALVLLPHWPELAKIVNPSYHLLPSRVTAFLIRRFGPKCRDILPKWQKSGCARDSRADPTDAPPAKTALVVPSGFYANGRKQELLLPFPRPNLSPLPSPTHTQVTCIDS